ncbi:MAG: PadR family transcriptional regulator [Fulvivirga sp.]|nr:PadR family transcriptional regulator [Fulvivirga sp.]
MHSSELLKGSLQTIILKLLADNQRMYGYEITQKVKALSDGKLVLTEGALYPTLHKLEAAGLLSTEKVKMGKRVRKYYALTTEGKSTVVQRLEDFEAFIATMFKVLQISPSLK